jgi:N-acetylglucosaminyl-diphospho-decaprenol L-rhamnosyltransferase
MIGFQDSITFVIVTFNSHQVITKCIESINSNNKIIVVENSKDYSTKNSLESKFKNVEVVIAGENLGYGKGNNLGISRVKTQYAFILNPDAYVDKNTIQEFEKAQFLLKDKFSIMAPNFFNNYGYFSKKNYFNISNKIVEVDYVKGFAMLLNLKNINFKKIFDENFFLFLEEIDLCKRIKSQNGKIYLIGDSKIYHSEKKGSGNSFEVELCRNWHWMWSLYYYNFKHFGLFAAYKITAYRFISSFTKMLLSILLMKKKKYLIHKYRLLGLINAYKGKSSWLRPYHINNI